MNAVASSLPVFFISSYYSQEITGLYNQTRIVILAPISLITLSLSQIYLEHIAAKVRNKESIQPTIKSILRKLLLISGLLFIISLTIAPMLFEWFLAKPGVCRVFFTNFNIQLCHTICSIAIK